MATTKTTITTRAVRPSVATNYSFITDNKWNVNTHNYMQLTKQDTNDDVDLNNCVVHTVR